MLWGLEGPETDDWEAGLEGLEARHASSWEMAFSEETEETRREPKRAAGTKERPEEIRRDQKITEVTRQHQKS